MNLKCKALLFCCAFLSLNAISQQKMRTLNELINTAEPGWNLVKGWIDSATNKVEILACDTARANDALYKTQVTTRSPMGAIIHSTGGLLIDNGWIRVLGSGHERLNRTLPEWNKGKTFKEFGERPTFLLVADDVVGGFFAINGGALGNDPGKVYYLAPDDLEWDPLDITYTQFLLLCFNGDLKKFYEGFRWTGWEAEVSKLDGTEVFNFFPPLWTEEGKQLEKTSRKPVPVEEQYNLNLDFRKQMGIQ